MRALWLLALLLAPGAFGAEEILRFVSDIQVHEDAALTVTETITVRAEGREIKRGIFRDFPTDYLDRDGRVVRVGFEVLSASRDGRPEPHFQQRQDNGIRLYLGSRDVFLDPGTYTYEIVYRSRGQLGFFEDYDEIYWNATGNGWIFPIREAIAVVRLPAPVAEDQLRVAGYTGPQGASGQAYTTTLSAPGVVRFETSAGLGPREGLTVAVGFPKGIVEKPARPPSGQGGGAVRAHGAPSSGSGSWRWIAAPWVLIGGVLLVVVFYFRAWQAVGRDPKPGVIIPRYESPENLSPAALRYIRRMKYDTTCLAAALVNLAVKGALTIDQEGWFFNRKFVIRRVIDTESVDFAPGEQVVFRKLLGSRNEFEFDDDNYKTVQSVLKAHEKSLQADHSARNFKRNQDKVALGVGLSVAAAAVQLFFGGIPAAILAAVVLLLLNLFFAWLMKAPTAMGRQLMDRIEGLKLYLGVAEKQTFENMDRPQTLEEFERLLPYAVALDCASTWVDRFEMVLVKLEQAGELGRRNWMTATGDISARDVVKSVDGLASGFTSSISSASSPPGSSSGSGGGGFSGGGGGGGGGGGW